MTLSDSCARAVSIRIGTLTPRAAQFAADVETGFERQHHVEKQQIEVAFAPALCGCLAVTYNLDLIALERQIIFDHGRDAGSSSAIRMRAMRLSAPLPRRTEAAL